MAFSRPHSVLFIVQSDNIVIPRKLFLVKSALEVIWANAVQPTLREMPYWMRNSFHRPCNHAGSYLHVCALSKRQPTSQSRPFFNSSSSFTQSTGGPSRLVAQFTITNSFLKSALQRLLSCEHHIYWHYIPHKNKVLDFVPLCNKCLKHYYYLLKS